MLLESKCGEKKFCGNFFSNKDDPHESTQIEHFPAIRHKLISVNSKKNRLSLTFHTARRSLHEKDFLDTTVTKPV